MGSESAKSVVRISKSVNGLWPQQFFWCFSGVVGGWVVGSVMFLVVVGGCGRSKHFLVVVFFFFFIRWCGVAGGCGLWRLICHVGC